MKRINFLFVAAIFAIVCAGFTSCCEPEDDTDPLDLLIGKWECVQGDKYSDFKEGSIFIFNENGTFTIFNYDKSSKSGNYLLMNTKEAQEKNIEFAYYSYYSYFIFFDFGYYDGYLMLK